MDISPIFPRDLAISAAEFHRVHIARRQETQGLNPRSLAWRVVLSMLPPCLSVGRIYFIPGQVCMPL